MVLLLLGLLLAGAGLNLWEVPAAGAAEVTVPYEWYRYQGEPDSGPAALLNCEVTTTAMAIQFARGGLRVPIKDVRTVIGHNGPTSSADAKRALRYWGVPTNDIDTIDQVIAAVRRGRIVIVGLMLGAITLGSDAGQARSPVSARTGRYSTYAGAHSIVVKGVSADGQWLTVYDPNHWEGDPTYLYADGTPKGKDRRYRTSEVAAGMRDLVDFPRAIEILGGNGVLTNGGQPPAIASPTPASAATPSGGRGEPRQSSDLVVLTAGSGEGWASAVVTFGVRNVGSAPLTLDAIGVRGTRPDGKPVEQFQRGVVLAPRAERTVSLILETPLAGEWKLNRLLYQQQGAWAELPAEGRLNQATFRVGSATGVSAPPPGGRGLKPSGPALPGPEPGR
jgi:hypothetical protein